MIIQLIILLPFFISLNIGIFGRFLGRYGIIELCFLSLSFLILLNFIVFFEVLSGITYEIVLYKWFSLYFGCDFVLLVDSLSISMSLLIFIISSCIIVYSFEYMEKDAHLLRFIAYLFLFVFFMVFLVFSDNLLQTFIGWEGVGLTSFLLINFWFTRLEANRSAFKAVLFNKISDAVI